MGCLLFPVLSDGDLTDTVSGPRSTASDLTSSKASTKSPTQRHNPFNEDQAETVSSSDTTPVHTTSQENAESHTPDLPDTCTELEVIRSVGGAERSWVRILVSILSTPGITFQSQQTGTPFRKGGHLPRARVLPLLGSALSNKRKQWAHAQNTEHAGNSHDWLLEPCPGCGGICPVRPGPGSTFIPREFLDINAQFLSFVLILVQHGSSKEKYCPIDGTLKGRRRCMTSWEILAPQSPGLPDLPPAPAFETLRTE